MVASVHVVVGEGQEKMCLSLQAAGRLSSKVRVVSETWPIRGQCLYLLGYGVWDPLAELNQNPKSSITIKSYCNNAPQT